MHKFHIPDPPLLKRLYHNFNRTVNAVMSPKKIRQKDFFIANNPIFRYYIV